MYKHLQVIGQVIAKSDGCVMLLAQLVKGHCLLVLIATLCSNQVALLSPLQQLAGKVQLL